jgi:glycosyltransferase involved in cell wall biosynthesis
MTTSCVFYEHLSPNRAGGLGFASWSVAKELLDAGRLGRVVCLDWDAGSGLPPSRVDALLRSPVHRAAHSALSRLGRVAPGFDARLWQERLFDGFARRRLDRDAGGDLYFSRPLFPATLAASRSLGMKSWVQSSVPHPLLNFALVRNEELRLGLKASGPYSNLRRAVRMASVIASADRVVTLSERIGRFTYDSYRSYVAPERLVQIDDYFSIDPARYAAIADARPTETGTTGVTFLHLSYVNLIKGLPYLLDAWRQFKTEGGAGCRLIVAGRIDDSVQTIIRRRYADLADVEYRGFVADLAPVLAEADVFVSSSVADAGPATILEAMSAGLPVVTSRNCGFASLVEEGATGYTYRYNDVGQLTALLGRLAAARGETLRMGKNARNAIGQRSAGRFACELIEKMAHDEKP